MHTEPLLLRNPCLAPVRVWVRYSAFCVLRSDFVSVETSRSQLYRSVARYRRIRNVIIFDSAE
jgi:hypothetical protein